MTGSLCVVQRVTVAAMVMVMVKVPTKERTHKQVNPQHTCKCASVFDRRGRRS